MAIKARKVVSARYEITLTLSETEASALRLVSSCISGPESGPRGLFDDLYEALKAAGVPAVWDVGAWLADGTGSGLRFVDACPRRSDEVTPWA